MKFIYSYCILLILVIITFLITFINKIGVHGDEAFAALDAIIILNKGIYKAYGMDEYTGIIQPLMNSFIFNYWGIDVISMRIGGILCNIFSLFIIARILYKQFSIKVTLLFFLLFAQSAILLCYSKIAWEVSSFNLLVLSLMLYSIQKIYSNKLNASNFYVFVFLFVTLIGSYNHIIFSSIVLALFISFPLWIWINKIKLTSFLKICFTLISISMFNIIVLYFYMNYCVIYLWKQIDIATLSIPIVVLLIQVLSFRKTTLIVETITNFISIIPRSRIITNLVIIILLAFTFIYHHSFELFDVLANEIIFNRLFSYNTTVSSKRTFIITASLIAMFVTYHIFSDLFKQKTSFWTYLILCYLITLTVYTKGYSIRYYHIITILLFLYASINLVHYKKTMQGMLIAVLSFNMVMIQSTLWAINLDNERPVKAILFKVGKSNEETSAHFINFTPVVDSLINNQIGTIETDDPFFIGNVFNFYKSVYPEIQTHENSAIINYDYKTEGSGFTIEKLNSKLNME